MSPAEDVQAFAELCARLNHPFSDAALVLRGAGLSPGEWVKVRTAWRERLGAGDAASAELGRLFGLAYAAAWARGPDTPVEGPVATPAVALTTPAVPATTPAVPATTPVVPVTTPDLRPATLRDVRSPEEGIPVERAAFEEAVTVDTKEVAAPPPPGVPVIAKHARLVTAGMPVISVKDPLPFDPNAPSKLAEPSPKPPERKGISGSTADVDLAAMARRVLVFGPEHARAEPPAGAAAVPDLTLEQYASLCAEIAVFPQHADATFQRYGLGSQRDRPSVDRAWRERLRRDPSLYRDWQDLYQRYQEYWTAQARRKPSG